MTSQILLPFNFKKLDDKYLLVNIVGKYSLLNSADFADLIGEHSHRSELLGLFYADNVDSIVDIEKEYRRRKKYLYSGTSLFIFVLTRRCNQKCIYCQASSSDVSKERQDMTEETARMALDLILASPNKQITIEFQGGEPLLNFRVLEYIVEYTKSYEAFRIHFNLVSNLLELNNKMLDYLIANHIGICTSLDGGEELHNSNRSTKNGDGFKTLQRTLTLLRERVVKVDAIQTTTKDSLSQPRQIVDQYIASGFDSIFLRAINPFGYAKQNREEIGYSPYEFLEFYKKSLDYIIELNKNGSCFKERTASIFLSKIICDSEPNYMDLRSPCGAGIGQVAINYDGKIYTCDEGRMLGESGDLSFLIGDVKNITFRQLIDNDVTKAVCLASCSECLPRCYQCAYQPYCGVCPVINYSQNGNLFMNDGNRCIINKGIINELFSYLLNDRDAAAILRGWVSGQNSVRNLRSDEVGCR